MIPKELIKKVKSLEISTRKIVQSTLSGSYQSAFKGKGLNFSDLRAYQIGDDVRNINWKVSARSHETHVNLFEEERELNILLVVDISGSETFGSLSKTKRDYAAEIAAILGFSAILHSDKVGLLLFAENVESYIPPKKGKDHVLRLLRDIFYVKAKKKRTNLSAAINYTMNMMKKKSVIFFISDFIDHSYEKQFKILANKHDVVPIIIEDPLENELPKAGTLAFQDQETNEIVYVNSSLAEVQKAYKNMRYSNALELERLFKVSKCDYLKLNTHQDYTKSLIHFFKKRQR
tara:strand:+ start:840 stop:1709 length:870 start_codon:yes stop_codon:yes gene_type:complete